MSWIAEPPPEDLDDITLEVERALLPEIRGRTLVPFSAHMIVCKRFVRNVPSAPEPFCDERQCDQPVAVLPMVANEGQEATFVPEVDPIVVRHVEVTSIDDLDRNSLEYFHLHNVVDDVGLKSVYRKPSV